MVWREAGGQTGPVTRPVIRQLFVRPERELAAALIDGRPASSCRQSPRRHWSAADALRPRPPPEQRPPEPSRLPLAHTRCAVNGHLYSSSYPPLCRPPAARNINKATSRGNKCLTYRSGPAASYSACWTSPTPVRCRIARRPRAPIPRTLSSLYFYMRRHIVLRH